MVLKRVLATCLVLALPVCFAEAPPTATFSGLDLTSIDTHVRPQDDFYRYCNGHWLDSAQIASDKDSVSPTTDLEDRNQSQLREIIERLVSHSSDTVGEQRKIVDLYSSFMDEAQIELLGVKPLASEFSRITALRSVTQVPALMAQLSRIGVTVPYALSVHQDAKDATVYIVDLVQDGLGMPDRDYYLLPDSDLTQSRTAYVKHIQTMLQMAGEPHAAQDARQIVNLETQLAKLQWTKVESRDPVKAYNRYTLGQLQKLVPSYNWRVYLTALGLDDKIPTIIVSQPSYLQGFSRLLHHTPLPTWKAYFRWRTLSAYAPYLAQNYAAEDFSFYGTALRGIEHDKARWKRGVDLVDVSIGEALGKLYVTEHFPPAAKERMQALVRNLIEAYRLDINSLDWMGPETQRNALAKLDKFTAKIGYPDQWRDYTSLVIKPGDLVGNIMRARTFEFERNLHKLGKAVDRNEWDMTPPTVNAYYNAEKNEIVFPAGILQPPFFDLRADDAANYAGIVSVIGHEISHGFDDYGSQYDGNGNLLKSPGWFDREDLEKFKAKTRALVSQYAGYAPVPGYPINGELTLGENIADNAGIAIAFQAYMLSLAGQEAPIIDGYTGAQRYFIAFTQTSRGLARDSAAILSIKSDPHSPDKFRALVPVLNAQGFYDAFNLKPGDKMYLTPEQRVRIW